jgi:hypothetical protein
MNFVQEGKLDEEKKRRQAEWERVRSKDDPIGKLYKCNSNDVDLKFNISLFCRSTTRSIR